MYRIEDSLSEVVVGLDTIALERSAEERKTGLKAEANIIEAISYVELVFRETATRVT
jgi:hypothetical protein